MGKVDAFYRAMPLTTLSHRRWSAALLITSLLVVLGLSSAQAQQAQIQSDPIILNIQGDLWAWNNVDQELIQLTTWGMNERPVLSPDGTKVAYVSLASIFADWLKTVRGAGGFSPPANIWILDIASEQTSRIADQPVDAVWNGPTQPGKYLLRSEPTWSPDGQKLAWIEHMIDTISFSSVGQRGTAAQLVVYDLMDETTQVLDSFTVPSEMTSTDVFDVQWGRPGIALKIGQRLSSPVRELRIYDPSGDLITETEFEEESSAGWFSSVWMQDADQDYLFDKFSTDILLNWQTGEFELMTGLPEIYSLSTPDGAGFFFSDETWHLVLPEQTPVDLGDHIQPYGISRDGQSVVYGRWEIDPATGYFAYTVMVHSQDQLIEIGRYQNVRPVWGAVGWRVRH